MSGAPIRPARRPGKRSIRNRNGAFCWTRTPIDGGGTAWRLFRRSDTRGSWHCASVAVYSASRTLAASRLAAARRRLLDLVDAMDLRQLGVIP